ncbi:MAG: Wzz/FepE/Etk N-terminal domain-containing protein [Bacillota bacterium]|nr:Wzz/FepE/Etk N-terminal domain-containing protein [Bacillota bacterium]
MAEFNPTSKRRTSALKKNSSDNTGFELYDLINIIKKKLWLFVILAVLGGLLGGLYTKFMVTPRYASTGTIFLTPKNSETGSVEYANMSINSRLVNTVISLMTKDNIMSEVAERSGLPSAASAKSTLNVTNEQGTEIISITSTTTDPVLSKTIVENTIDVFIEKMQENLNVKNIEIVDAPKLDYRQIGVNRNRNIQMGALAGVGISSLYVLFLLVTDNRLKTKEEAERYMELPVLIEIPKWK